MLVFKSLELMKIKLKLAKPTDRGILTKGALGFARAFDIAVVEEEFTAAVLGADFLSPLPPEG